MWNCRFLTGGCCYRTNSHAGLPRGAYTDPHPKHFHIATPSTQLQKPAVVRKRKQASAQKRGYVYSARSAHFPDFNTHITVSYKQSVFNVPLRVVREFVYPFASILNVAHAPALEHAESQTSFMSGMAEAASSSSDDADLSDFECGILRKLRSNLVNEVVNETSTFSTADEGFDDTTNRTETLALQEPSEAVVKMSGEIFKYLKEQCFEINELVLFPELIHNEHVQKLMERLKILFEQYCLQKLTEEEKNELRIQIATEALTQTQLDEVSSASPDTSFISDKAFSTSEFISDILDRFFCYIDDDSFSNFRDSLTCTDELSSTPQVNEYHEVTSFKKSVAEKSGNETFWFSLSKTTMPLPKSPLVKRNVVNVDDIPLKPPPDLFPGFIKASELLLMSSDSRLTPIAEESRRKLDFSEESSDEDENLPLKSPQSLLPGFIKASELLTATPVAEKSRRKLDFSQASSGEDENHNDCFAGGDTCVKILPTDTDFLRKTTHFQRTNTEKSTLYINESVVEFERLDKSTDEGDWMGFEGAKF